ncbi:MAG TPA: hypothetical protein PKE64_08675 [Anaerolineae bacterium]|nr:hypothetical protein [Anaerolineae bacterium]HMR64069.1 hypothetical protein [Anaerolineae bacterium]
MLRFGRVLATTIAIAAGLFVLADIFATQFTTDWAVPGLRELIGRLGELFVGWTVIIAAFALLLGFGNVVSVHWHRIRSRQAGAVYSGVLLVSLIATLVIGLLSGGPNSASSRFIFDYILEPLEATLFALLAVFIATAAFRAFRVRNLETFFFVLFAVIVLLGQIPLGIYLWSEFPVIKDWILNVPTLAGTRGILLGVALGTIATGLRLLIGADRPYTD